LKKSAKEFTLKYNTFIFKGQTGTIFYDFLRISTTNSSIYLLKNNIDYSLFSRVIYVVSSFEIFLRIEKLFTNFLTGSLIEVAASSNKSNYSLFIFIRQCKIVIKPNPEPFMTVRTKTSLSIDTSSFYLSKFLESTFILNENKYSPKGKNEYELQISNTYFQGVENNMKYIQNNSDSKILDRNLIHSISGFERIVLQNTSFMLGSKHFKTLLFLKNTYDFQIIKCLFLNNILNLYSHLIYIMVTPNQRVYIINSTFAYNKVIFGGFLSLEINNEINSLKLIEITRNQVFKNAALNKGGLFYINFTSSTSKDKNFIFEQISSILYSKRNKFYKNYAASGQILYFEGDNYSSDNLLVKTLSFRDNNINNYNNIGSSIKFVGLSNKINNNILSFSEILFIKDRVINKEEKINSPYFCFEFFDEEYNRFSIDFEFGVNTTFTVNRSPSFTPVVSTDKEVLMFISYRKGAYCVNKIIFQTQYQNIIGKIYNFYIDPFKIFKSFFPNLNELTHNISKGNFIQIVAEIEDCKVGEVFNGELCIPCERNQYSLEKLIGGSTLICTFCRDIDPFFCYGGSFRSPKKNFWRFNNESENFLRCPSTSCDGDVDFNYNISNAECINCNLPGTNGAIKIFSFGDNYTSMGSCKYGYRGILCAECINGYGSTDKYRCGDCSSIFLYIKQIILMTVKLGVFSYTNWKALKDKLYSNTNFDSSDFSDNVKSNYLLKILFMYFNFLSVLMNLPFEFDPLFKDILTSSVNISPSENFQIFSSECLFRKMGLTSSQIYLELVLNLVFFLIVFSFFLLGAIKTNEKKITNIRMLYNFVKSYFRGIFLLFFMDNIVMFLAPFVSILFCINVGDEKAPEYRLLKSVSLHCWDQTHKYFVFLLSSPTILLIGLITPIYIFHRIYNAQKIGKQSKPIFVRVFGYFMHPYRDGMLFYETFVILNKIGIIILKDVFISAIISKNENFGIVLILIYIMCFYMIQVFTVPYKRDKYYVLLRIDRLSYLLNISNSLTALIWHLTVNENNNFLNFSLLLYLIAMNVLFFIFWLQNYSFFLRAKMIMIRSQISNIFSGKAKDNLAETIKEDTNVAQIFKLKKRENINKQNIEKIIRLKTLNKLLLKHIQSLEELIDQGHQEGRINDFLETNFNPKQKNMEINPSSFVEQRDEDDVDIQNFKLNLKEPNEINLEGKKFSDHFFKVRYTLGLDFLKVFEIGSITSLNKGKNLYFKKFILILLFYILKTGQ
jgi:hypothetical protein